MQMNIDKEKLNQFLGLSDEEFKQKVADAAKKVGLESDMANDILKNTKHIKKMIGNMNESQLENAFKSMGDDKIAQMIQNLQNSK